jgi:hypothetical protein
VKCFTTRATPAKTKLAIAAIDRITTDLDLAIPDDLSIPAFLRRT